MVDEHLFGSCQRLKLHDMQYTVGGKTALRAVVATLALASAACSSSPTDTARSSPTVRTEPPTTTTTNPYAVPAVIDAAYVNRVLAGLDAALGDVTRLVVRTRTIPREAYDRLRAIYADSDFLQIAIDGFQLDMQSNFSSYKPLPGDRKSTVTELISARLDCIFAQVRRDYSEVGVKPSADLNVQWIGLKPLNQDGDSKTYNPTSWAYIYDGYPASRTQPRDPCVS